MSALPDALGVHGITATAQRFAELLLSGKDVDTAAKDARLTIPEGRKLMMDPRFRAALESMDASRTLARRFDEDLAHDMLVEAYGQAESAEDQIKVVRELSKLHGLDKRTHARKIIDAASGDEVVDYESLTDEQLERMIAKEQRETGGHLPPPHPKA